MVDWCVVNPYLNPALTSLGSFNHHFMLSGFHRRESAGDACIVLTSHDTVYISNNHGDWIRTEVRPGYGDVGLSADL